MSWLREDDSEVLDAKIARLTGEQYRELHALRQFVAREHPGPGGVFSRDELGSAVYGSPRGGRSVSPATFEKLCELDLVRAVDSYVENELRELEEDERTNRRVAYGEAAAAIREAQTDERKLFRCNRWEHYNGASDRTATERKRRQRERLRGDIVLPDYDVSRVPSRVPSREGHGSSHAYVTASAPAQPVPSLEVLTPTSDVDRPRTPAGEEGLTTGQELAVARLLSLLGDIDEAKADYIRGAAARLPESVVASLLELCASGHARDRVAYVMGALRRELEALSSSTQEGE